MIGMHRDGENTPGFWAKQVGPPKLLLLSGSDELFCQPHLFEGQQLAQIEGSDITDLGARRSLPIFF